MPVTIELTMYFGKDEDEFVGDVVIEILEAEPDVGIMSDYADDWYIEDRQAYRELCAYYGKKEVDRVLEKAVNRYMLEN